MKRIITILTTVILFAAAQAPLIAGTHPNIVFILSDDQGWNDIGYHNPEIKTPTLDRLAAEGVRLDCHYVMPQCTPTRVALMTGKYPSRFGPHCMSASNDRALPPGTPTLASMLKGVGYETALCGKWHLGSLPEWGPNHYGFDHSYGCFAGASGMYDHRYRLSAPEYARTWHRNHEYVEEEGHATDLATREAVEWIEKKRDKPFFLYVPFQAVHTPLVEEDRWIEANSHIKDPERRLFAAAVMHMDDCVRQIVEALERTGVRKNTLILFSSDNGAQVDHKGGNYPPPDPALTNFSSNDPLRGKKTQAYEGGYRVPAFANWPGVLESRVVESPMHLVDWVPTLTRLAGVDAASVPEGDGVDVWPVFTGEAEGSSDRTFYIVWRGNRLWEALRHGDWKVVRNNTEEAPGEWELYNLADDPYETTNLAGENKEILDELLKRFEAEKKKDKLEG